MTSRGLQRLSEDECRARLASRSLGRIGLRIGESPVILPVNYAVLDGDVVFRTDPGSKLTAALMGVQVAFEIDGGTEDPAWSVLVVGYAEEVRDQETLARVEELELEPWVEGHRDRVVRITPRRLSGRCIAR